MLRNPLTRQAREFVKSHSPPLPTRRPHHATFRIAVDGLSTVLTAPLSEMILLPPGALLDRGGMRVRCRGLRPLEKCDRHDWRGVGG